MYQPNGFKDSEHLDYVCKFKKAIYSLKQAPQVWFNRLKLALIRLGFHNFKAYAYFFVKVISQLIIYILVYLEDIIITH